VSALPIFRPGEFLAGVPQGFLTTSIRMLTTVMGYQTHAVALANTEVPTTAIDLPMVVVAGIVALVFLFVKGEGLRAIWTVIQTCLILGSVFFSTGFIGELVAAQRAETRELRARIEELAHGSNTLLKR